MGSRLTVREGHPFLFSKAVAVFDSKQAAEDAIKAVAEYSNNGWRFAKPISPGEVPGTIAIIRLELSSKKISFCMPNEKEAKGRFG